MQCENAMLNSSKGISNAFLSFVYRYLCNSLPIQGLFSWQKCFQKRQSGDEWKHSSEIWLW